MTRQEIYSGKRQMTTNISVVLMASDSVLNMKQKCTHLNSEKLIKL
jgi:hypothetical protein